MKAEDFLLEYPAYKPRFQEAKFQLPSVRILDLISHVTVFWFISSVPNVRSFQLVTNTADFLLLRSRPDGHPFHSFSSVTNGR